MSSSNEASEPIFRVTVELDEYQYTLLQAVVAKITTDYGMHTSVEEVARQMILRELRRTKV
jgi:hypothetical protein